MKFEIKKKTRQMSFEWNCRTREFQFDQ